MGRERERIERILTREARDPNGIPTTVNTRMGRSRHMPLRKSRATMEPGEAKDPTLANRRLRLFQVVFDLFDETGEWPSVANLERQLVDEMDVYDVLEDMRHPWANVENGPEGKIVLRLPAIVRCNRHRGVTDAFMSALRAAVRAYFSKTETPEITQALLVSEEHLSNLRAHQALRIYYAESLWSGINGKVPGDWIVKVDRSVRPYRDVSTIEEYIERKYGRQMRENPLDAPFAPAVRLVQPRSEPEASSVKTNDLPLIFLSHSGSAKIVAEVAQLLKDQFGNRVTTWTDADITGGKWSETIRQKLTETRGFVVVATPPVLGSLYVGFETGYVDHRLGQRHIFVLRAGVDMAGLRSRPPLAEYQAYDATDGASLADFCRKLGAELKVPLQSSSGVDLAAAHILGLVAEEAKAANRALPKARTRARRLINDLEQQFAVAQSHALVAYGPHMHPSTEPFDVKSCKDGVDAVFDDVDPQTQDVLNNIVRRLRHANTLIALAMQKGSSGPELSPEQRAVFSAAQGLRDPLVEALFHVRRCFNFEQKPPNTYPRF
jgi:hypothetical protein